LLTHALEVATGTGLIALSIAGAAQRKVLD